MQPVVPRVNEPLRELAEVLNAAFLRPLHSLAEHREIARVMPAPSRVRLERYVRVLSSDRVERFIVPAAIVRNQDRHIAARRANQLNLKCCKLGHPERAEYHTASGGRE